MSKKKSLGATTLAAVGIVYGDIGTSPLYTLRECLTGRFGVENTAVFGFLSLIFWLLVLVVTVKYISFVMCADNNGEGGILTLTSLAARYARWKNSIIFIGLIGGSFFYGEVVITPAISIMSAIEGLDVIAPSLNAYIVPLSVIVLTLLFLIQKKGSSAVSSVFSPIMLVWFLVLALLGIVNILKNPSVLQALNPLWAVKFFYHYKIVSLFALGSAVLAITGVEALYADMGHFGKSPIRIAWLLIVFPSLTLNYFGQGALLLAQPGAIKNPFFLLAPHWAQIPLLILTTLATVIASQAVISGVFSLTRQAIRYNYLLPMRIIHTSENESGQIYIPVVNWILYLAVLLVVVIFKHSSNLAAAYGIAVTGTMVLTTILSCLVAVKNWHWRPIVVGVVLLLLLGVDIPLFIANLQKLFSGGWLPLSLATVVFIIMSTWKNERAHLLQMLNKYANSLEAMITSLEKLSITRVQGTAVYFCKVPKVVPFALLHNKVLHERIILLTLQSEDVPYIHNLRRVTVEKLSKSFSCVIARYGWRETPHMEKIFYRCGLEGLCCYIQDSSFFMSYETLVLGKRPWILRLRGILFILLQRNALRAPDRFKIPPDRVIQLGKKIEI